MHCYCITAAASAKRLATQSSNFPTDGSKFPTKNHGARIFNFAFKFLQNGQFLVPDVVFL